MCDTQQARCPLSGSAPSESEASSEKEIKTGHVSDDPQLPKREIGFYVVLLASIVTYAGYDFYQTYGRDLTANLPLGYLRQGWLRKYRDLGADNILVPAANNWKSMVLASLFYLFVSKVTLRWAPMAVHHITCATCTLVFTGLAVSVNAAMCMTVGFFATLFAAYYSLTAVWLVIGSLLYATTTNVGRWFVAKHLASTDDTDARFYAMYGYTVCRLLSIGHSLRCRAAKSRETGEPTPTLWQHIWRNLPTTLNYVFYMPQNWTGPLITYEAFMKQVELRARVITVDRPTAVSLAWRFCRLIVWYFVLELFHHYLPVGSYLYTLHPEIDIKYKHMSFSMFIHGQVFMLLYVQYYGWPALLARLDGIELPHWPDCISRVYSYSIMWRVFDRGLCAIMQAHVYLPLGGNRHGPLRQFLAVCACFAFIGVFHGNTSSSRAWVTLNVIQLLAERVVTVFYMKRLRSIVTKYLSPQNEKRLVGYVISWNMMISCGVIFFLFTGDTGFLILPEFLLLRPESWHTPVWHMVTKQIGVYCCVQIGRYYEVRMRCCALRDKVHKS